MSTPPIVEALDKQPARGLTRNVLTVLLSAWSVPGAGHFVLGRRGRGLLLFLAICSMFALGLLMRGSFYTPRTGDLLTTIIYCGGFLADLANGVPYLLSLLLGYSQPEVAGHVHDYGTKFLVASGLLNILAIVDAYEIATGKKE